MDSDQQRTVTEAEGVLRNLRVKVDELEQITSEYPQKIAELAHRIDTEIPVEIKKLRATAAELEKERETLRREKNELDRKLGDARRNLPQAQREVESNEQKLRDLANEISGKK